jgi:membrane protein
MKAFYLLLRETFRQWNVHRVPKMGAALSFYTVFSLAPLAILVLSLLSLVVERNAARAEIVGQFFVGDQGAEVMELILQQTAAKSTGLWRTVTGFVVLLVGASGVFGELQDSLNQIWGASSKRHPVFTLVKERIFSFSMVFVMGFLLLVSLMFSAAVAVAGGRLHARFPDLDGPWAWGNDVISLIVVALLFAMIFRLVPDVPITWKDVWLGAVISAVLFELGRFLLGFYFGRSALAANYGAAGSLIIILVWVYYTAQILFFGAAFTRVYSLSQGSHQNDDKLTSAA